MGEARNKNEVVQASESEERQRQQQREIIGKAVAFYPLAEHLAVCQKVEDKIHFPNAARDLASTKQPHLRDIQGQK